MSMPTRIWAWVDDVDGNDIYLAAETSPSNHEGCTEFVRADTTDAVWNAALDAAIERCRVHYFSSRPFELELEALKRPAMPEVAE